MAGTASSCREQLASRIPDYPFLQRPPAATMSTYIACTPTSVSPFIADALKGKPNLWTSSYGRCGMRFRARVQATLGCNRFMNNESWITILGVHDGHDRCPREDVLCWTCCCVEQINRRKARGHHASPTGSDSWLRPHAGQCAV